ncbi:putative dsRNA-binding protein [Shewanella sp. 10N.286.45.A1]|uniref:putative dsRNA-binding protein n=1 Tax=Shewanella sp. 10N.286.45.A1 TaxID=3229694 RepID=UPI0035536C4B
MQKTVPDTIKQILNIDISNHELWEVALCHRSHADANSSHLDIVHNCGLYLLELIAHQIGQQLKNGLVTSKIVGDLKAGIKNELSHRLNEIPNCIKLGPGVQQSEYDLALASIAEQLIGVALIESHVQAIYDLAKNMKIAHSGNASKDPKTLLQELCQKKRIGLPTYNAKDKSGPEHQLEFIVDCQVGSKVTQGKGPGKKKASTDAASKMLTLLTGEEAQNPNTKAVKLALKTSLPEYSTKAFTIKKQTPFHSYFEIERSINIEPSLIPAREYKELGGVSGGHKTLAQLGSKVLEAILARSMAIEALSEKRHSQEHTIAWHIRETLSGKPLKRWLSSFGHHWNDSYLSIAKKHDESETYKDTCLKALLGLAYLSAFSTRSTSRFLEASEHTKAFGLLASINQSGVVDTDIQSHPSRELSSSAKQEAVMIRLQSNGVQLKYENRNGMIFAMLFGVFDDTDTAEVSIPLNEKSDVKLQKSLLSSYLGIGLDIHEGLMPYPYKPALYQIVSPLLRLLWTTSLENHEELYSSNEVIPIIQKVRNQPSIYKKITLETLLNLQSKWSELSLHKQAELISEIRYRLEIDKEREPLENVFFQPQLLCKLKSRLFTESTSSLEQSSTLTVPFNKPFKWPTTVVSAANDSIPETQWPKVGILRAVGYRVGKNGEKQYTRHTLLGYVLSEKLPLVDGKRYMAQWEHPNTTSRLKKLANTIAALTRNAKRKNMDMNISISNWEADLNWLKEKYYDSDIDWGWPKT